MAKKHTLLSRVLRLVTKPNLHVVFAVAAIGVVTLTLAIFIPPLKKTNYKTEKPITKHVTKVKKPTIKPITVPSPVAKPAPKPPAVTPPPAPKVVEEPTPKPVIKPVPSSSVSNLSSTSSGASSTSTSSSTSSSSGATSSTSSSPTPTTPTNPAPDYTSSNWSGYVVAGQKFTTISGTWVQPKATGNGTTTMADATWIGIGGITTSDLIQVGTDNTVEPNGSVVIGAFYELLPNSAITIPNVTISAGDTINASINEIGSGEWTISITDVTDSESFSINVSYTSSNSSAEWVEEDPSDISGNLVPFDNYGSVDFTQALTTANGTSVDLAKIGAQSVAMVNSSNQIISSPSAIGSDGASFSVTRENF